MITGFHIIYSIILALHQWPLNLHLASLASRWECFHSKIIESHFYQMPSSIWWWFRYKPFCLNWIYLVNASRELFFGIWNILWNTSTGKILYFYRFSCTADYSDFIWFYSNWYVSIIKLMLILHTFANESKNTYWLIELGCSGTSKTRRLVTLTNCHCIIAVINYLLFFIVLLYS